MPEPIEQTDADLEKELAADLPNGGTGEAPKEEPNEPTATIPEPAVEPEPPVEPAEEPPVDTVGGGTSPEPEPVKVAPPAAAGADVYARVVPDRPDHVATELTAITAKIKADDFDPYSKDGKEALLRHSELQAEVKTNQAMGKINAQSQYWTDHDADKKNKNYKSTDAKADWQRIQREVAQDPQYEDHERIGAAKAIYFAQLRQRQAPAKSGGGVAPTPITSQGGRVVPPSARAVPPQPKSLSDEDELVQSVGKVMAKIPGQRR